MSPLVYGIGRLECGPLEATGIGGGALRAIGERGLAAVLGGAAPVEATERTVWEYEVALERLMADHAVLPARFGSELPDAGDAIALIRERRDHLEAALDLVAGAVELAVRAVWTSDESPSEDSGTSYMLGRLELQHRARRIATTLEPLGALARARRVRTLPRPDAPFLGAYLVDRDRVEEFVAATRRLDGELGTVGLSCTGPWPPYTFAQGAAA